MTLMFCGAKGGGMCGCDWKLELRKGISQGRRSEQGAG